MSPTVSGTGHPNNPFRYLKYKLIKLLLCGSKVHLFSEFFSVLSELDWVVLLVWSQHLFIYKN